MDPGEAGKDANFIYTGNSIQLYHAYDWEETNVIRTRLEV